MYVRYLVRCFQICMEWFCYIIDILINEIKVFVKEGVEFGYFLEDLDVVGLSIQQGECFIRIFII